jgi:hypothetical protein
MFWQEMYKYDWNRMPYFWWILTPLLLWDLFWKAKGLWHSARNKQLGWFIAILIVNSLGILPIIYLAFFQKKKK